MRTLDIEEWASFETMLQSFAQRRKELEAKSAGRFVSFYRGV